MKHIKIQHLLGAVAMTALLLTGCAKDNSLTDITPVKEQSKDDSNEVIHALSAIEGITDAEPAIHRRRKGQHLFLLL